MKIRKLYYHLVNGEKECSAMNKLRKIYRGALFEIKEFFKRAWYDKPDYYIAVVWNPPGKKWGNLDLVFSHKAPHCHYIYGQFGRVTLYANKLGEKEGYQAYLREVKFCSIVDDKWMSIVRAVSILPDLPGYHIEQREPYILYSVDEDGNLLVNGEKYDELNTFDIDELPNNAKLVKDVL